MLSKAIFIHSHINLAYKSPFIIRDLRSRTITAASQAKDAVGRVRSVTQLEPVRVKGGMSLRNGLWHGLRNDIIMRNLIYAAE